MKAAWTRYTSNRVTTYELDGPDPNVILARVSRSYDKLWSYVVFHPKRGVDMRGAASAMNAACHDIATGLPNGEKLEVTCANFDGRGGTYG